MELATTVPLSTALADLDEVLRALLERELEGQGFDGVEIAFDAPDREWAAKLSGPAINLYLYDLEESAERRQVEWERDLAAGIERRPPLWMEASYAVTAWTREVEDEHRLLSQVMAVLYAYPQLRPDDLNGTLAAAGRPIDTRVGRERHDGKADFWSAVGGQYKASIDFVVTLACDAGTVLARGPEVRSQSVGLADSGGGERVELHRAVGRVRDAGGDPVAGAWIVLPELGRWAASRDDGRFVVDRIPAGEHRCEARAPDGREVSGALTVPGPGAELVLAKRGRAKR
ncbi:MAG TPA: Pvc16 family protein [Solirubrobacterales bacterium]|nr:Pvc16 family protein [Solirubrobacterales bacterium]